MHFCVGAPLARLEAGIALSEFPARIDAFSLAIDVSWAPCVALNVLGLHRLPLRLESSDNSTGHTLVSAGDARRIESAVTRRQWNQRKRQARDWLPSFLYLPGALE